MSRLALVVLLLLAACAPPPPDPAPAPAAPEAPAAAAAPAAPAAPMAPAAPDAPAAPAAITGDYTVTLALADVTIAAPDSMRQRMVGTYVVALHNGGHFVLTHNGREVAQGPYTVSGSQLTLPTGDSGPYACNSEGRYTWQMNNDQLTLTRVQDECEGRRVVLSTRPLARRG